jgi:phosphate transport system substrate-binding protein
MDNVVDFAVSDTPITLSDYINSPDMVSMPMAAQAAVIVYNLPGIADGSITLSMNLTSRIFLGEIYKWNHPSIVALNPGVALPNVYDHKTVNHL